MRMTIDNAIETLIDAEYQNGRIDGRNEILADIAFILKRNKYPEYVEMDICDYLESRGVKL